MGRSGDDFAGPGKAGERAEQGLHAIQVRSYRAQSPAPLAAILAPGSPFGTLIREDEDLTAFAPGS